MSTPYSDEKKRLNRRWRQRGVICFRNEISYTRSGFWSVLKKLAA